MPDYLRGMDVERCPWQHYVIIVVDALAQDAFIEEDVCRRGPSPTLLITW